MASRLTTAYQKRVALIGSRASTAMERHWHALPAYDESDIPHFTKLATPTMAAAKAAAVATAAGYYATRIGRRPVAINPRDVDVEPDFRSPFIAYWTALKNGHGDDATTSGLLRVAAMTTSFVVQAGRHTATPVLKRHGVKANGWIRVPDAGACEFCQDAANNVYPTEEAASFEHGNNAVCHCAVDPNI